MSNTDFGGHADPVRASAKSKKHSTLNSQHSTSLLPPEPLEARIAPAALVAHWIGGDGKWSEAAHWDIGVVPTNGGGNTYTVVLDVAGATPQITVDTAVTISGLTNAEALHLTAGTFTLANSLTNTGTMNVQAGATLDLTGAFTAPVFGSLTAAGGTVKLSGSFDPDGGSQSRNRASASTLGYLRVSASRFRNATRSGWLNSSSRAVTSPISVRGSMRLSLH
jgi:hypothetical protein